ncbi:MAG: PIG-L family deacetylase, partial [Pseudomonadota bacterium]
MQRSRAWALGALGALGALALASTAAVLAQESPQKFRDGLIDELIDRPTDGPTDTPADTPTSRPGVSVPEAPARSSPPGVLVILAHPDDEITIAPVLTRIARDGGKVTLIFATSGSAGPGISGMAPGEDLARLREDEGRCAAFALGLDEPIFWQLGDGELATLARVPD